MLQSNWLSYNTLSAHARATFSEGLFGLAVEANFESRFAGNLPGGLRLRNYKFSWRLSVFALLAFVVVSQTSRAIFVFAFCLLVAEWS